MVKYDMKALTEGGMMCALACVILLINRQTGGWLEIFFYWIMTLPLLVYTVKYGLRNAFVTSISLCFLSLMIAAPTTIFYVISAQICALVYGNGILHQWKKKKTLWLMGFCLLVSYIITTILFARIFGFDPNEDIIMAQFVLHQFSISTISAVQFAIVFSFLFAFFTAWAQTACIHMFSVVCLKRLHLPSYTLDPLSSHTLKKQDAWICLVIWFSFFYGNMVELEGIFFMMILLCYLSMCVVLCMQCILASTLYIRNRRIALCIALLLPFCFLHPLSRNCVMGIGILSGLIHIR